MQKYLITGGAGFIGINLANRLLSRGYDVTVFDNLSRKGSQDNLNWLRLIHGNDSFQFIKADIRDKDAVVKAVKDIQVIIHLAAQVAVTTSVQDPRLDFDINALGTFNLLEAARQTNHYPIFLYASTNKVYGGMEDIKVIEKLNRYDYQDFPEGIDERVNLDFHSPYGCSKGCGDQYVRDFWRIYQIPTVVFRQSCIYGKRQFGVEDQGWVAWFVISTVKGYPLSIFGNGKQVRDLLYVDDLIDLYESAINNIEICKGKVFNVGGGFKNSISIWTEFSNIIKNLKEEIPVPTFNNWRPGDQKIYISNINKAKSMLHWEPNVSVPQGINLLYDWVVENQSLFA